MKITTRQLKQIIREELANNISESQSVRDEFHGMMSRAAGDPSNFDGPRPERGSMVGSIVSMDGEFIADLKADFPKQPGERADEYFGRLEAAGVSGYLGPSSYYDAELGYKPIEPFADVSPDRPNPFA